MVAYCRSKIANTCFGMELQHRHPELKVYVVHPGTVRSAVLQSQNSWLSAFATILNDYVLLTPEQGCQSTLLCCLTEEVAAGSYFHNVYGDIRGHESAYDLDSRKEIWQMSEALLRRHQQSKQTDSGAEIKQNGELAAADQTQITAAA